MRVFVIFICSVALLCFTPEIHAGKHKDKKSGNSGTASNSTQNAQRKSGNWATPTFGGKAHGRNGDVGPSADKPTQWGNQGGAGKTKSLNNWNNPSGVNYSKKENNWSNTNQHNQWNSTR